MVQATAGTLAGACSSIITTPIDTVKTRLQVNLVHSSLNPEHAQVMIAFIEDFVLASICRS